MVRNNALSLMPLVHPTRSGGRSGGPNALIQTELCHPLQNDIIQIKHQVLGRDLTARAEVIGANCKSRLGNQYRKCRSRASIKDPYRG
jgi:hypothetical protein